MADEGLTLSELPVPAAVPVQLPVNHCQDAPVPRDPPLRVKVVVEPAQTVLLEAATEAAAELSVLSVTVVDVQAPLPQAPSART